MSEEQSMIAKSADEKYCIECVGKIETKAEQCPHCGVRQNAVAPERRR